MITCEFTHFAHSLLPKHSLLPSPPLQAKSLFYWLLNRKRAFHYTKLYWPCWIDPFVQNTVHFFVSFHRFFKFRFYFIYMKIATSAPFWFPLVACVFSQPFTFTVYVYFYLWNEVFFFFRKHIIWSLLLICLARPKYYGYKICSTYIQCQYWQIKTTTFWGFVATVAVTAGLWGGWAPSWAPLGENRWCCNLEQPQSLSLDCGIEIKSCSNTTG